MSVTLTAVVAVAENGVIGFEGDMPWHLSTDLKRFKAVTMGKPIVMGRKTLEAIGKPLPGRLNIIVSRQKDLEIEGCAVVDNLDTAIELASATDTEEVIIGGGGTIYAQAMDRLDKLHITVVHAQPKGDTKFPEIDSEIWELTHEEAVPAGEKDTAATTYRIYERK